MARYEPEPRRCGSVDGVPSWLTNYRVTIMTALRKHSASALEHPVSDAAAFSQPKAFPDSRSYEDDVTPEGIEAVRKRVEALLPKGEWKVIDGYAGDRAPTVG